MILVVGSTGVLGSEICCRLATAGKPVRGLVRSTSAPEKVERLKSLGVQTVLGDLRDPASLAKACSGVDTVITTATTTMSMQPGDSIPVTDQQGQLDLVKAAKQAGVRHFIMVSIPLGVSACPLTTAKRTVENAIMASGMTYTILRPCIFMEIWLSPALGFDYTNAKVTLYGEGHTKNGYVSVGDVAQYVVESLDNPAARNEIFEIAAQSLNLLEVVRFFEKAGGKSFELSFVPEAALAAQRAAATDPLQHSFATLMLDTAQGHLTADSTKARAVFKFPTVSVADYAQNVLIHLPVGPG